MNLSFLGAARDVTASCDLVEVGGTRFLVDCGMGRGGREAPARNYKRFAFDPLVEDGFIGEQDVQMFTCVDTAEEIVAITEAFHGGKPPAPEAARG